MKKYNNLILGQNKSWGDCRDLTYQSRVEIGFPQNCRVWQTAKPVYRRQILYLNHHPIMDNWEKPYMKALAQIAASNGGTLLEIGFGLGIAANFIQKLPIQQHIIIEANRYIAQAANIFAKKSLCPTKVLEGFWQKAIKCIPDQGIDGILFDTYPLSKAEIHRNHFQFFKTAHNKLKTGGVFTYYSDEIDHFSPEHLCALIQAGFKRQKISGRIIKVNPPANCQYWQAKTILAPIIIK